MKLIQYVLLIIVIAASVYAQPSESKNKELSFSGSYQNYSSGSSSESTGALLVSSRLGFFVHEGLELEPELLLMISSGIDPVYMINGNVSYNFISNEGATPFLLVGYGLANTVPYFNVPLMKSDFGVGVLNLGAGIKIFIKEDIAVRIEYRFQSYNGEGKKSNYGNYSYTQKLETRIHSVQFGLSILL